MSGSWVLVCFVNQAEGKAHAKSELSTTLGLLRLSSPHSTTPRNFRQFTWRAVPPYMLLQITLLCLCPSCWYTWTPQRPLDLDKTNHLEIVSLFLDFKSSKFARWTCILLSRLKALLHLRSKYLGTTLATQQVVLSSGEENASANRGVTPANMVTKPATYLKYMQVYVASFPIHSSMVADRTPWSLFFALSVHWASISVRRTLRMRLSGTTHDKWRTIYSQEQTLFSLRPGLKYLIFLRVNTCS